MLFSPMIRAARASSPSRLAYPLRPRERLTFVGHLFARHRILVRETRTYTAGPSVASVCAVVFLSTCGTGCANGAVAMARRRMNSAICELSDAGQLRWHRLRAGACHCASAPLARSRPRCKATGRRLKCGTTRPPCVRGTLCTSKN